MELSSGISKELRSILKEHDTEKFLFKLQNHLIMSSESESQKRSNMKYNLAFYRNLPLLDRKLGELNRLEQKLLKIKVNTLISYLDDINKITFPSPFIIGVFTAVISLVIGVMIKDPSAFPGWAIMLVVICFVLFIPGISWFTLEQSGKNAELKEALTTVKEIVN
ncbi:hypothetical protein CFK37_01215 [Virgibacillus phasianinus]|uniref:Uncharacterized protein n=1 Tax=Virgibacillus phasianinus TaxID=2017483 RepID=A0A220TZ34_9BACI|nr:hypothetical protein [Virgibacillus phasianinus]ASK60926.1 hypothetical protein CFK37_01215 [Virgibacillus phasianinus]